MGLLRFFLALSVIAGHAQTTVWGSNGIGAWYAVNFFFIISGFYMAMVMNEKYSDAPVSDFYVSRALRLFPVYYVGLIIALMVSMDDIVIFFHQLNSGGKVFFIAQNLFIFGQDLSYLFCIEKLSGGCASPAHLSVNAPSWSLSVELMFYLVAPFVLKSGFRTLCFFLFGCLYIFSLRGIDFPVSGVDFFAEADQSVFNYYIFPSSIMFFGAGALAYHLAKRGLGSLYFLAVPVVFFMSYTKTTMPFWHLLIIGLAIPVLFSHTKNNRLDRWIGELSYPAYILHFPVLIFLGDYAKSHPQLFSHVSLGSWVALVSCLMGAILHVTVEKRVNRYRREGQFFSTPGAMRWAPPVLLMVYFMLPALCIAYIAYVQAS